MSTLSNDPAGLVIVRADAKNWDDPAYRQGLLDLIDEGIGGVCVFLGGLEQTASMIAEMQMRANGRLLVSADYEHGLPMRLDGGIAFPRAMALGRTLPGITEHVASCIAEEAAAIGVHWNFAPVCDVNADPRNPIINTRSFGDDATTVALHAAAYVRGTQARNVLACAKHAPGHGDTHVDSHVDMPTIHITREIAEAREFVAFRSAIRAGVRTLMVGHIMVPFLDASYPASLSAAVVTDVIRGEWGFKGLIVTDAMDMKAIADRWDSSEAAVLAFQAGNDAILLPENAEMAIGGLRKALANGSLTEKAVAASLARWNELRTFVNNATKSQMPVDQNAHAMIALQAADAALSTTGDLTLLPILGKHIAAFAVVSEHDSEAATMWLHYLAGATEGSCDYAFIDGSIEDSDLEEMSKGIEGADVVLFAFFGRAVAYRGALPGWDRLPDVMTRIAAGRPIIVVSCGSPYGMEELPADFRLYTYSETMPSLAASVMRLVGRSAAPSADP